MTQRCRHERNSWLIAGGYVEWCYVCGAFRRLKPIEYQHGRIPTKFASDGPWHRPSGDPDVNSLKPEEKKQ